MKKILIAGAGHSDIPLILSAKALGFYVITSGNRENDLGHEYADEVKLADYSDKAAILAIADSLQIDAICPGCNDFSYLSCAYVAEKLRLPGYDTYSVAKTLHHKNLCRIFAKKINLPSPQAAGYSDFNEAMLKIKHHPLPIIIKPVDLTGGKGISKIESYRQAEKALALAFARSKAKQVVVEAFIEGTHHGFSTFLRNGKVVFFFHDNEHYYLNPYLVSAASSPSIVDRTVVENLCTQIEKIASALVLVDGIFHVQYVMSQQGPVIIEVCRRAPGDLYVQLVQLATGVDYPQYIVQSFAGLECNQLRQVEPQGYFIRHCVMADHTGEVRNVLIAPEIKQKIVEQFWWWKKGDVIHDHLNQKLGIVFLRFQSMQELLDQACCMHQQIKVAVHFTKS